MAAPRQMTAETLNALKGWPRPNALDFNAAYDPSVADLVDRVPAGSVGHVNASGYISLGVGTLPVMGLFSFQASDAPDVENDGGDAATTKGVFIAINPTGQVNFLVATGAYELVSTSYNTAVSYAPNAPLTSPLAETDGVPPGQITTGVLGTDNIVGIVSSGVVDNGYGYDGVAFWPVFAPPVA